MISDSDSKERRPSETGAAAPEQATGGLVPALVGAAIVITGLYFARPVLEPLALAALLSLTLAPAVSWLQHRGVRRGGAVALTVFLAFAVILGFGAAVGDEAVSFVQRLPQYEDNLAAKIHSLNGGVPEGGVLGRATRVFRDLGNDLSRSAVLATPEALGPQNAAPKPVPVIVSNHEPLSLQVLRDFVGPLLAPLASAGLVLVFVIIVLVKREDLRDRVLRLAGAHDLNRTTAAMNEAAERVSKYLLMQLGVGVCYGVPIGIGLALIGIPNALLWGLLGVMLRFMPYIGGPLTAVLPVVLAIAVSPGWGLCLWTVLLFAGAELVVANVIEPWAYSRSTGLSAVAVVIAAVFWTWLWGVIGLLLATPLTVCLAVLGRYVPQLQFLDIMLGNQAVLSPHESLYQRLLARDPEEAAEQAEEFGRQSSLDAFFDDVAIPALALAQADSDRGALSAHRRAIIAEGFAAMLENLAEDGLGEPVEADMREAVIVCLAGRNELDLAAAWLLQRMLQLRGRHTVVFSPDALSTFNLDRLPLRGAAVVCLSLLGASSTARARYQVRRLRRQARRARLLIGCWGERGNDFSIADAVAATAADQVVSSLAAAVADIEATLADNTTERLARQSA